MPPEVRKLADVPRVKPFAWYTDHNEPSLLVGYNGHGDPMAVVADERDIAFICDRHHPPSASIWMVAKEDGK
jgi:hypothetical protein